MAARAVSVKGAPELVFPAEKLPVKVTGMQAMAGKMWAPWLMMGFMMVAAALIIDAVNANAVGVYFQDDKVTRDAAAMGSIIAERRASIESINAWLPSFKFLGMGFLFGGITFLLATILGALRTGGGRVQQELGVQVRIIKPPMTAKMFPMVMMMGFMVIVATMIIAIPLAVLNFNYWNHSIANDLNTAAAGSNLLQDLGTMNAMETWIVPLRFFGLAVMLTAIGLALATIVRVLRWQSQRLTDVIREAKGV